MENRNANKSIYGILMTALFYATGSICTLRVAAWLAARTLLPIVSHILWSFYNFCVVLYSIAGRSSGAAVAVAVQDVTMSSAASLTDTGSDVAIMGLFSKKLVRAATNHDLFVPVQTGISSSSSHAGGGDRSILFLGVLRTFFKSVVLFSIFVGACGVGVYYFTAVRYAEQTRSNNDNRRRRGLFFSTSPHTTPPAASPTTTPEMTSNNTKTTIGLTTKLTNPTTPTTPSPLLERRISNKTKLNPSAPTFTPSSASPSTQQQQRRLDPTARAFTPRINGSAAGKDRNNDSAPPSPADSVGPVTPSPVHGSSAFTFDATRVYNPARYSRRTSTSVSAGVGGMPSAVPVGVGKMRVVRPEEVVIGERRAGEVFVFF